MVERFITRSCPACLRSLYDLSAGFEFDVTLYYVDKVVFHESRQLLPYRCQDGFVVMAISDTGCGIKPELL